MDSTRIAQGMVKSPQAGWEADFRTALHEQGNEVHSRLHQQRAWHGYTHVMAGAVGRPKLRKRGDVPQMGIHQVAVDRAASGSRIY